MTEYDLRIIATPHGGQASGMRRGWFEKTHAMVYGAGVAFPNDKYLIVETDAASYRIGRDDLAHPAIVKFLKRLGEYRTIE